MTDQELILKNIPLVKIVTGHVYKSLCYQVEYEDLLQYAYLGLMDAIERFNPDKSVEFSHYAFIRIRGYVLDEVRKIDPVGKYMRARIKAGIHEDIKFCSYDKCVVGVSFPNIAEKLDLVNAIKQLSLIERQVIYYYYIQGLPFRRIIPKVGKKYVEIVEIHDMAIDKLRELIA